MDKEQAIDLLDNLIGMVEDNQENDYDTALRMAIEALKAQLSCESTTSDTISRAETVEHLRRVLEATVPNTDYDEGYIDGIEFGISTVSTMPTTQTVATDTNVGDTISRQAAIDEVKSVYEWHDVVTMERLIEHINNLPPAQPEDYTELKQEFLRMASYIDVLLECSDAQKETLIGFISRLAEFMPWTEGD